MSFRSKPDGSHFPLKPAKGISLDRASSSTSAWNRTVTKAQLHRLKTLENPLLWNNFLKTYQKLNPDFDFDAHVDRTLEVEEALNQLQERHPEFKVSDKSVEIDFKAEFREDLEERGIDNTKVQNLIAKAEKPLSEEEIAEVAGALHTRTDHAVKTDKALKAPLTEDPRKWSKHPNRLDIKTVDRE
jgi:hypothetical protein